MKYILIRILNKPIRSILILFSIVILGSFVSSSYSIHLAVEELNRDIQYQVGTKIYVTMKSNGIYNSDNNNSETDGVNIISDYLHDDRVAIGDIYNQIGGVLQGDYTAYSGSSTTLSFTLYSTRQYPLIDEKINQIQITNGRSFSEEEINTGKNVVIINGNLRNIDDTKIKVGDKLQLFYNVKGNFNPETMESEIYHTEYFEFEVIGIYKHDNEIKSNKLNENNEEVGIYLQDVYVPYETIKNIGDKINEIEQKYQKDNFYFKYGDVKFLSAYFELKDTKYTDDFLNDIRTSLNSYQDFTVIASKENYMNISNYLNKLDFLSWIVIFLSVFGSFILFSLIIYYDVQSRRKEIGILLSLGEHKKNIILRVFAEIWLIGLIALGSSFVIGNKVGKQLAQDMILKSSLIENDNEQIMDKTETYTVNLDMTYFVISILGGSAIILITSIYPVNRMLKISPKELL